MGTVGAVALDAHGHLAAATSTGGMTNKLPGRLGDSPDRLRHLCRRPHGGGVVAPAMAKALSAWLPRTMCARMAYGGASLEAATHAVVHEVTAGRARHGRADCRGSPGQRLPAFQYRRDVPRPCACGQAPESFIYR